MILWNEKKGTMEKVKDNIVYTNEVFYTVRETRGEFVGNLLQGRKRTEKAGTVGDFGTRGKCRMKKVTLTKDTATGKDSERKDTDKI